MTIDDFCEPHYREDCVHGVWLSGRVRFVEELGGVSSCVRNGEPMLMIAVSVESVPRLIPIDWLLCLPIDPMQAPS